MANGLTHTAAYWIAQNIILGRGETGLESDTNLTKTGDGVTAWNSFAEYNVPIVNCFEQILSGDVNKVPSSFAVQQAMAGIVAGSGVAGQIAFWNGTNSIAGDAGLVYDSATDYLKVNGRIRIGSLVAPTEVLDVTGNGLFSGHLAAGANATINSLSISNLMI